MSIQTISQTISTIPEAGHRGVDVQTVFVNKQEDFQDHLQGTTVTELNTFKTQLNTTIGEINTVVSQVNTDVSTATTKAGEASTSANTATTKAGEASTSAGVASASATKASQWAENALNVPVETGKYSAKHWATVAAGLVNIIDDVTSSTSKTYSSSKIEDKLSSKVNTSVITSVYLTRADKYLAAQAVANMVYNGSGKLTKVQYNNATDVEYEVLTYNGSGKLSNVAHYTASTLRGNTVLSYSAGKLVSAIYTGV